MTPLLTPDALTAHILYRDALMLVIDKPAGLPVHPGHGGGETLEDHLDDLRLGLPARPQIVHRLDRDTSGCLALGRHPKALRKLNDLFAARRVTKIYHAWLDGVPDDQNGLIDCPIAPLDPQEPWRVIADPHGTRPGSREARTRWRVLEKRDSRALVELRPVTGRTHQLRVHCAHAGWPICGDSLHGNAARDAHLLLHARALIIPLYPKRDPIRVEAPLPAYFPPPAHSPNAPKLC
jgi:tRNA pseudouridine32 synthase/23S rRNA pseudouridine746 synthase